MKRSRSEADQARQALHGPGRRTEGHSEEHLHRQACPDRVRREKRSPGPFSCPPHRHTAAACLACRSAAAPTALSGSNQMVSEPGRFSASLQVGQFPVLSLGGMGLLMQTSYQAGFTRRIPLRHLRDKAPWRVKMQNADQPARARQGQAVEASQLAPVRGLGQQQNHEGKHRGQRIDHSAELSIDRGR